MLEIDFLPVEATDGPGSKSGDAIALRFSVAGRTEPFVAVIDAGYTAVGEQLVAHIAKYYGTSHIDLVVSTHPDADHLNGLVRLVEEMDVDELMLHLPWSHHDDVTEFSNIEKVRELYSTAIRRKVTITEPFSDGGLTRADGAIVILGPSRSYYEELLESDLGSPVLKASGSPVEAWFAGEKRAEESPEPLDDVDGTSARNNSSVVIMLTTSDEQHLFTGDAGITALDHAMDFYEARGGDLGTKQIEFFQVPHHGSRRNLGPAVLDRLFPNGASSSTAFISSGLADEKHPGIAVTDELRRRGFSIYATEGRLLLHSHDADQRSSYYTAPERN
jgi:beta-lactamase superfamily II metal-dependent hydrolase